ncbi:MAG TPA: M48 family metallopeptidase [Terracidiphilus sp.]|nr:M48 family metallopeptidase [Terracidiphilus sp.]
MKSAGLCRWAFVSAMLLATAAPATGRSQSAEHRPESPPVSVQARPAAPQDAYTLPPNLLAKAVALSRIRNVLDFGGSLWGIAFLWLLLATRAAARVDRWTQRIVSRRWLQGLIFFALFLIAVFLAGLPFDWFAQQTSRSYGISVQSWPGWLRDEGTSLAISLIVGAPLLLFFNWIVRRWPRRYWFVAWLITLPLTLIAVLAQPLVIDPLFNKFEPLQNSDPALVQQLEKVVQRTGIHIPPDRMFLMKASAKTNGLNAYVTGIGPTKRIVVWDTTAGRVPNDEILFIFAHETGHYVLHHIPKGLAISAACIFFLFWICAGIAAWLARLCGSRWQIDSLSSRSGFVVLLLVLSIAGFLIEPGANAISRHFEHQADVYGQEAIHGIVPHPRQTAVAAFNALGRAWLENPHPSPFAEFWLDSHPSIQQRAKFAAHYDPWKSGGHGKYFENQ